MKVVGIDIGGTNIKAGVVDEKGNMIKSSSIKTQSPPLDAYKVLDNIVEQIKNLVDLKEISGIGIGCPGAINGVDGVVEYSNNLVWKKVNIIKYLQDKLKIDNIKVSNDANVAALGECKFGVGKGYSDMLMVTLGTGVGGGIVVDGKLFEGYKTLGAELGHTVIRVNGVKCTCGRSGCLEAYTSATSLIRDTINAMMIDKTSAMWDYCERDLNKVDGLTSFECAKKGDRTANEVVENYCNALGDGITNFVNIFRSQIVVLGGGVSAQGEYLTSRLQKIVDEKIYGGTENASTKILTAKLGNDAGVLGAASLVL